MNFNPKASNIKLQIGYYYLQSRYYDPQICRFINADSFNFINTSSRISINAYAYCNNDPINFVDPTGCYSFEPYQLVLIFAACLLDGVEPTKVSDMSTNSFGLHEISVKYKNSENLNERITIKFGTYDKWGKYIDHSNSQFPEIINSYMNLALENVFTTDMGNPFENLLVFLFSFIIVILYGNQYAQLLELKEKYNLLWGSNFDESFYLFMVTGDANYDGYYKLNVYGEDYGKL